MTHFLGKMKRTTQHGFALIEVLVACAIVTMITFGLAAAAQKGILLADLALRDTQASFLLEEGNEAMRSIRDASYTTIANLSTSSTYYLSYDASLHTWSLTTVAPSPIDGIFTRSITVASVSRDGNNDIASSGTPDTHAKKATVTVSWQRASVTKSKSFSFYLIDIFS